MVTKSKSVFLNLDGAVVLGVVPVFDLSESSDSSGDVVASARANVVSDVRVQSPVDLLVQLAFVFRRVSSVEARNFPFSKA